MFIGEISKRTGFSPDTIRWYEKIGLIQTSRSSNGDNDYRTFGEDSVRRLQLIKGIKVYGFTIKEVGLLLEQEDMDSLDCSAIGQFVNGKIAQIEAKIKEMELLKSNLESAMIACRGDCKEDLRS